MKKGEINDLLDVSSPLRNDAGDHLVERFDDDFRTGFS